MESWVEGSLSTLLGFPVPDDMIKYVMSIENKKDLEEYMKTLLDFENPNHKGFFTEFIMKKNIQDRSAKTQKKKISKNKQRPNVITEPEFSKSEINKEEGQNATNNVKKKTKFINLYSQDGQNAQVVLLKGRHHCDCQASKHSLVNNCLTCGRIVCKQEGSGPCLFCGTIVCTPEEQREMNAKTKAGAKLMESLMEKSRPKGWEAAILHRNKLLEYDRTSERRTHVTDDDSDYFSSGSVWLSASEREKLEQYQQSVREKKHASRRDKKITFDFGGRKIIEEESNAVEVDEGIISKITSSKQTAAPGANDMFIGDGSGRDVAPGINGAMLEFDPSVDHYITHKPHLHQSPWSKVQDAEIQEMVDAGKCMSMHQPWASLLVEGIKIHEGRTWYSSHRGRLWIAATAKPPDQETVRAMENFYTARCKDKEIVFPSFYPTGCLLGCVNVENVLPQEEYQKICPEGESDSPYVFICANPMSLRLRFPVKGQHKIYNLDKTIHQAAVKFMQKMAKQDT